MDLTSEKLSVELLKIQDLVDTSENVRKLIECPVCLDFPLPPIYLCRRGHIVCSSCQNKTVACPLCRDSYSSARSFVAEGIVEKLCLPCKYQDDGCKTVMFGRDIVAHVKECEFRPLKCLDCKKESHWVSFGQYFEHLKSKHKVNGVSRSEGSVVYSLDKADMSTAPPENKYCWPPYYYKCYDEKVFLVRVHGNACFVCIWVSFLGTKEVSKNYEAQIFFNLESEKPSMLTWRGEVNDIRDDSATDVISKGRGLILPLETILQKTSATKGVSKYVSWTYFIRIVENPTKVVDTIPEAPESDEIKIVRGKSTSKTKIGNGDLSKKEKKKAHVQNCTDIAENYGNQDCPIVSSIAPPQSNSS